MQRPRCVGLCWWEAAAARGAISLISCHMMYMQGGTTNMQAEDDTIMEDAPQLVSTSCASVQQLHVLAAIVGSCADCGCCVLPGHRPFPGACSSGRW